MIEAELADGTILEFPDGTDPSIIQQRVKSMLAQQQAPISQQQPSQDPSLLERFFPASPESLAPQARQAVSAEQQALEPVRQEAAAAAAEREQVLASLPPERRAQLESMSPLESGLIGMGSGFTKVGRAIGLADPETEFEKQSLQELKAQQPLATGAGEILGETAPFVPLGLGVAALPGRAAQIGGMTTLGALEAGTIARGEGRDINEQIQTAGIGALVAGGLEVGIPVVGRIGGKIIRKALGRSPKGAVIDAAGKPSQEFVEALAESGQTFDDVIKQAQDEIRGQALDPRQAARKAFLESQGIDPTTAQVSRSADDFMAQQEAAKVSGRVREALEKQDAILTSRFNNKILETTGDASTQSAAVADFITDKATTLDQEIGDLYAIARKNLPGDKNVRFQNLAGKVRELFNSDRRSGGNVSAVIGDMQSKGILDKKGKLIGRVNVDTSEDLRKLMNELYDEKNPYGNSLLRQMKDALDDDVFSAAGEDIFKQARKAKTNFERELARAKISKFDSRKSNIVRDILENKIDPEQMVDKVVFSKSWRPDDLQQLKDYISTDDAGKAAFNDMRAEVMQKIRDKAFFGPEDASGMRALSRDKLERAVKSIGAKKLDILFNPDEHKFLRDMIEVSKMREPVRGTAIGRGPSAQAISRIERKLKDIPWLGQAFDVIDIEGRKVLRAKPNRITIDQVKIPAAIRASIAPAAALTAQQEQQ